MDNNLEAIQIRRQEVKLKLQLKNWEKSFEKVNGRKPNRDDIKRAGSDVKEMYKHYWFIKANPGKKYVDKKEETNKKVEKVVPKQSTSGIAFFEDSIKIEKPSLKSTHVERDPIMNNLMMSFKSNKKSFLKSCNKGKAKKVPVLDIVPESPDKERQADGITDSVVEDSASIIPQENNDDNGVSRNDFLRKIFHGEEDEEAYRKEAYEGKKPEEDNSNTMFEGCTLLPIGWKPKAAPKRRVTSKKKSAENFIRLDMKHKSFASKGYKKFNVQKYKRKQHRKLRRDKCFCCGESGHWANDCPMKLSNKPAPVDEDGIPILDEDQIVLDDDSEDLVVKVPTVVYASYANEVKSTPAPAPSVPEMSRSERLFMAILNDGKEKAPLSTVPNPVMNFAGSSFGSSGESIREASNENESRDSLQYNLFDEDDMMEEFLGKEKINDILAII